MYIKVCDHSISVGQLYFANASVQGHLENSEALGQEKKRRPPCE